MILHIDMDAFYASVERLDDPELDGKCIIVGGLSNRSVVCAASYEARKFGVHSAMPMFQARRKCPDAVFISPRISRYKDVSEKIMAILKGFSPLMEIVSIDEAYLDVTRCRRLFGAPEEIAAEIKARIKSEIRMTCSVGVAPNKFLAKIASDMEKPDGLTVIPPEEALEFIKTLPLSRAPGVGKSCRKRLDAMGLKFLGDLWKCPEKTLEKRLGTFGIRLKELSQCMDRSRVEPDRFPKSVSAEKTLPENSADKELLKACLLRQSGEVGRGLRRLSVKAKTIILKIKHADFKGVTRSHTLSAPTQSSNAIFRESARLLENYPVLTMVRLIGVGASGFVPEDTPMQMGLFSEDQDEEGAWEKLDQALDAIYEKYGPDMVKMGSNIEN